MSCGCALVRTVAAATKAPGAKLPVKQCTDANACATVRALNLTGVYPDSVQMNRCKATNHTPTAAQTGKQQLGVRAKVGTSQCLTSIANNCYSVSGLVGGEFRTGADLVNTRGFQRTSPSPRAANVSVFSTESHTTQPFPSRFIVPVFAH